MNLCLSYATESKRGENLSFQFLILGTQTKTPVLHLKLADTFGGLALDHT